MVLGGALCLSASAVLVKVADVDAATTAMLRCAIALVILVPLALRESRIRGSLPKAGIVWAILAGIALGVDYAAWTAAIYRVGAGISTVLINIQVVVLPLLSLVVDRERVSRRFWVALPLMISGISLVGGVWSGHDPGPASLVGTMLGLVAGIGYGVYLFLTRRATRNEPGRMVQPLAWSTGSATVTAAALAPMNGGLHVVGIGSRSWLILIVLAVLGQVIAWLLIHHGSTRLAAETTAALLLVQPIFALVLSALVLSERPSGAQMLGAGIVVVSVAVANGSLGFWRNRPSSRRASQ